MQWIDFNWVFFEEQKSCLDCTDSVLKVVRKIGFIFCIPEK